MEQIGGGAVSSQAFAAVEDVDPSTSLWRYMSLRDFLTILDLKIRLTQVAQFPDRHEGRVLEGTQRIDREIAIDSANRFGRKHTPNAEHDNEVRRLQEIVNRHMAYAACWTTCDPERPEMWLAYTNSAECVAVRTSAELMGQIPCREEVLQLSPMQYYEDPSGAPYSPVGPPAVLNKRRAFEFEREIRLIAFSPPEIAECDHITKYPQSIFRDLPDGFILEVVAHPEASSDWLQALAGLVHARHEQVLVRQSALYRYEKG